MPSGETFNAKHKIVHGDRRSLAIGPITPKSAVISKKETVPVTAAVMERLVKEPHTRLRYFCSPQHTDRALHPIIGQMEHAAGFVHDDTATARLDKLDVALAQALTSIENAAPLAETLSLSNDGRHPAQEFTEQQRRERTLRVQGSSTDDYLEAITKPIDELVS